MDINILYQRGKPYIIDLQSTSIDPINKGELLTIFIEGKNCQSKQDLFDEFSDKLNFYDFFGNNWDAFCDTMRYLEGMSTDNIKGIVIIIKDSQHLLRGQDKDLSIFKDIINTVGGGWNTSDEGRHPMAFHIILN